MPNPVVAFFDVDGTLTYRDPVTGPTDVPTRAWPTSLVAWARTCPSF